MTKDWLASEFVNQEMLNRHRGMEMELTFYDAIAHGDLEAVRENCRNRMFVNPEGVGKLSHNPIQNLKYHFVVTAAMIVRYCVNSGMELEKAYSLSDFYILKADELGSIEELSRLHDEMCLDLCRQMQEIRKEHILSKPIVLCVDYIYSHLHYRITIQELAEYLQISESYLSRLFKKEMGLPISKYILEIKIDHARNLLRYSEEKIVDIANYLAFASESHFIQVFQNIVGETPLKYRKRNFRSNWSGIEQTPEPSGDSEKIGGIS